MSSPIWYIVYEGGELKPGYEAGYICIQERLEYDGQYSGGEPSFKLYGMFFKKSLEVEPRQHERSIRGGATSYLVSLLMRDIAYGDPKRGPYQSILSSPPRNEAEFHLE